MKPANYVFSDKMKIFGVLEINFRRYFVPFMTRDPLNFWAKSCKNMINLAIRTKQRNKKCIMQFTVNKRKLD